MGAAPASGADHATGRLWTSRARSWSQATPSIVVLEQLLEVALGELLGSTHILGQDRAHQLPLLLAEIEHLFLDGALGDETVHRYDLGLANAVGAIGRLVLDRRIPPRVEVNDRVSRGEVQ